MIIDLIAVQARRHLETINLEVPDEVTIEEIIAVVIDSPHVVSHAEHDKQMDEVLNNDRPYWEGYEDGKAAALRELRELKQSPNPEIQPGPAPA